MTLIPRTLCAVVTPNCATRVVLCSLVFLFAVAWLLWIDGAVIGNKHDQITPPWYAYLIGVFATFVFVLMNLVSLNDLHPFALFFSQDISGKVRAWLFVSFACGFGVLGGAIYICVDSYGGGKASGNAVWPGVALVLQSALILASAVVFLFARQIDEENDTLIT